MNDDALFLKWWVVYAPNDMGAIDRTDRDICQDGYRQGRLDALEQAAQVARGMTGPGNTIKNAAGYTAACNEIAAQVAAYKTAIELNTQECNHWAKQSAEAQAELSALRKRMEGLVAVLREISEAKGRFSRDNHQHAKNTIEDMKELALNALRDLAAALSVGAEKEKRNG